MSTRRVATWDQVTSATADVRCPVDEAGVVTVLQTAADRGQQVCVRGGGFSIGDVAILDGGVVLETTALDGERRFDPETGELVCGAGTRIADLLALTVLRAPGEDGADIVGGTTTGTASATTSSTAASPPPAASDSGSESVSRIA